MHKSPCLTISERVEELDDYEPEGDWEGEKNAQFKFLLLDGIDQENQWKFIVWISTRQLIDSSEKEGASLEAQR